MGCVPRGHGIAMQDGLVERRIETCVIYQCSSLRIRYDQSDTVVISILVQKLKG